MYIKQKQIVLWYFVKHLLLQGDQVSAISTFSLVNEAIQAKHWQEYFWLLGLAL